MKIFVLIFAAAILGLANGQCRDVSTITHGTASCSSGTAVGSVCTYQCDTSLGYRLHPANHSQITCMSDNVWDQAPPCCTRNCPPYAEMDMVMVLDSSSSVKKHNWATLKTFGKSVINAFEMTGDTTRLAAFRYNNLVDTKTQILLNQHISDKPGFIASYDKILYKGRGTLTGQALRHAKDVILATANGNRPGVKDVVLTITDGRSHDDVFAISNELRQMGVLTYVVGINPGNGKQLNLTQLNWIAGSSDHLFMANAGFSGLTTSFAAKIGLSICTNPCRTVVAPDCLPARVDPLNGAISCTNANKARSVCTSTCNPGYNLVGSPSTICDFAGNWTQPPATCEVMQCSPIQTDPAHGHVTCTDSNNVGSECTFTCDAGYHLTGQNKTTCGTNTLWSNDPPVCVKIKCHPQQSDPLNGNVTCTDSNNEGSQCNFQCNEGYVRVGAASSTCQDDGNGDSEGAWSATAPTCERITCVPPHQTPVDGIMTCTDTNNYGSKCDFNCTAGHVLVGEPQSECRDDGNGDAVGAWTSTTPTCVAVRCEPGHNHPNHGNVLCTNGNMVGSSCVFTCNKGYELVGNITSNCKQVDSSGTPTGDWDAPAPTCKPKKCQPDQVPPTNGNVVCTDGNNVLSSCTFTCSNGYFLQGNNVTDCTLDAAWTNNPPTCIEIVCTPEMNTIDHGTVSCSNSNKLGSTCSFVCDSGYKINGFESTSCRDDYDNDAQGVWGNTAPTCEPIICLPSHTNPTHGMVNCTNSNNYGSDCVFTCNTGYTIVGDPVSSCRDPDGNGFGDWSSVAPVCHPVLCDPPHQPPTNGQVTCTNGNMAGSRCVFTCEDGYLVSGHAISTCNAVNASSTVGAWSHPAPVCTAKQCSPPLSAPTHGSMVCSDAENLGSTCTFNCAAGYSMVGQSSSVCKLNGDNSLSWSHHAPVCTPITCLPEQAAPTNGGVTCTNTNHVASVCSFTCSAGYAMVGPAVKLCEDDGNGDNLGAWNITDDTTCQPIVCLPRHTAPANGAMSCSNDNLLNSVCTFSCSDGYAVVGSPTSTCNDDGNGDASGVWSTQAPTCERIKCNDVSTLRNGVVTCTDGHYVHSVCTYKCTSPMVLYPENHNTTTCLSDTTWSLPPPCCTKACPPNAVVDLVIVLDSSSSVKGANWGTMKTFVKNIVGTLNVSPTGVRVGAFKYSENVDMSSQMFLNQTTNLRNFYRSFNQIKYKGQGTKTGKALRHAKDVILAAGAGNRPGVTDVLLTITDGRAQDDVLTVSNELRAMGVKTFVVGVIPGNGLPIGDQHLLDIAGSQDRVFKATGGFSDLTDAFASKLSQAICSHQCPA